MHSRSRATCLVVRPGHTAARRLREGSDPTEPAASRASVSSNKASGRQAKAVYSAARKAARSLRAYIRITPRWIKNERTDTVIGAFLTNIEAAGLVIAAAFVFAGTRLNGAFVDVATTAHAYTELGHTAMGIFLPLILLNASIIGACVVSLSTAYAFGDVFKLRHSLHHKLSEAKAFYGTFMGMIILAGAIVLIPNAPLGLLTLAVQALAGILLPSATVFLVLLCNDRDVLGP